jgi:hypothetical protein
MNDVTIEPLFGTTTNEDKLSLKKNEKNSFKSVPVYNHYEIDTYLFCKHFKSQKPVKLKGFMNNDWKNWSPESLVKLYDDQRVTVFVAKDNRNFIDNDLMCQKVELKGKDFFDIVFNTNSEPNQRLYFRSLLPDKLLQSIDQSPLQRLLNRSPNDRDNTFLMRVWIGTAGNITPLHYDRCHGILSQLHGTKKITLISPKRTQDVYPHDTHSSRAHCSRVDMTRWDEGDPDQLQKFPRFDRVKRVECILEKGDILYTPPGWWHHVHSLTASISITVPFDMNKEDPIPSNMII